jgi:hypothetical protein
MPGVTRRDLLRTGLGASAALAFGCGGGAESRAPAFEPLRLAYGGFEMGIQSFSLRHDTGHFIRSGIDPVEALRRFGARLHGVHLKDFVSEGALAEGCILGAGKLDLGAVFRTLRAIEFRGALSLEYERNPEAVVPDLIECLRAASEAAAQS